MIPVILVLALVAGAVYVDHRLDQVQRVDVAAGVLAPVASGAPFNVLVVGTDGPRLDGTDDGVRRSDSIMILHVDESAGVLRSMSLPPTSCSRREAPRPTGSTRSSRTVVRTPPITAIHDHLGIAIAHYVEIDFDGFERIVDAVGGLTVQPSSALRDANTGLALGAGCQHVDGTQALQLVRARHLEYQDANGRWILDPTGDIGRMEHQQDLYRLVLMQLSARLADPVTLNALLDAARRQRHDRCRVRPRHDAPPGDRCAPHGRHLLVRPHAAGRALHHPRGRGGPSPGGRRVVGDRRPGRTRGPGGTRVRRPHHRPQPDPLVRGRPLRLLTARAGPGAAADMLGG